MFRLSTAIAALAAACVVTPAISAPDRATFGKQVDALVESQMHEQKVPGVAVAVLHKGEIVLAKGYGLANVEHNVPVTTDTIFQSGSVGKMFTAVAVMTQVEHGKIKLDDPVSKYLPGTPPSWSPITVRNLLTHTSGIPNYGEDFNYKRDYTDDELLKVAYALPLDFKPGARWSYSNTGYEVLGILVKKATGRSYLDILQSEVFKPLGMKTARGISDLDIVPHRAAGYQLVDGVLKNQDWTSATMNSTADGSLYFSLKDMIAWNRGVEKGAVVGSEGWKQIYTPVRLNSGKPYPYGFGWELDEAGGQPRYHHGGAWAGFRIYYSRYLGDEMAIILLTNSAATDLDKFVDGIAGLWDPKLTAPLARPKPEPEVDRRVTALIEAAQAGALTPKDLPLAKPDFVKMMNDHLAPTLKPLAPLSKLDLIKRREVGDDTEYTYTATFGDKNMKVHLAIAPGNQVSQFYVY